MIGKVVQFHEVPGMTGAEAYDIEDRVLTQMGQLPTKQLVGYMVGGSFSRIVEAAETELFSRLDRIDEILGIETSGSDQESAGGAASPSND